MSDDDLRELFVALGPIGIRRLFGGKGIYCDGRIVAVVVRGELYLKTDEGTASRFEAACARRWTYAREGRQPVAMPYHTLPDEALDDPDAMAVWAQLAAAAAARSEASKARSRSGRSAAKG